MGACSACDKSLGANAHQTLYDNALIVEHVMSRQPLHYKMKNK